MKNTEYKLLSPQSKGACPAVVEKGEEEIVVIGTLLSSDEENDVKQATKMGVAKHERVVRIPRAIFDAAVNKLLTEKAEV